MFTIRPLTVQDLPALIQLYLELYRVPTQPEPMLDSFRRMAANPDYHLIGAFTESDDLVGSALVIICHDIIGKCQPWAVVENVIAARRVRGQGLGKLLMAELEGFAHDRGCSYIQLTSSHDREPAHRFYRAIGYSDEAVKAFRKTLNK